MSFQRSLVLVSLLVASASSMHTPYALRDVHRNLFHKRLNTPSPLVSREVELENAIAAQSLNAQFASLDANSQCTDGQVACIAGDFAECWQGKYVTTKCHSGLQCYALPSVNEAGTTVTCDTPEDALARFAAAGSTSGITGSGSTSGPSPTSNVASASTPQKSTSTAQSTASSVSQATSTTKASGTPTATIRGAAGSRPATSSTQETTSAEETSSADHSSSSTQETTSAKETSSAVHSSTHSVSTQSSAPPQQTPSSTLSSSNSIIEAILSATTENPNSGDATWYNTGLTACGVTNNDNQFIVAVSEELFDNFPGATANPNENPICNKQVEITFQGKTQTATVTDRCTACKVSDLDMTPALFQAVIGDLGIGRQSDMTWRFN